MTLEDKEVFDYEYDESSGSVEINTLGSVYGASLEDYPEVMSRVINILQEIPEATSVVLSESRDYEYDEEQVRMLKEIAQSIQDISAQGYLSQNIRTDKCESLYEDHLPEVQRIVFDKLRKDPVGAYVKLTRKKRHLKQQRENSYPQQQRCLKYFIQDVINPVMNRLEDCQMIQMAQDYTTGHHVGDREIYREFFHPLVRPNFMLTKFMSLPPERGEEIERYTVQEDIEVSVYRVPDETRLVYHVNPPEFDLPEEKYTLLDAARRYMASHQPESGEFARPEKMRDVFENIGKDMLRDIAAQMDMQLSQHEVEQLTDILNRYTSGLGVLELLLSDPKIQDVYINSPVGSSAIYITHEDYEECKTNLIPTKEEAESWATRFRIQSGRPLDEANPVLDTNTEVKDGRARVAVIQENLSPEGLAFAFRRHRSRAWTLPLFIQNGTINSIGAALISFIVDGNRSVLFAGTRGAGKCVTGDSIIQLSNGNIVEIQDMVGEHKKDIDDGTIHNPSVSENTISLSDDRGLSEGNLSSVWKREAPENVVRIRTRSGREIVTTPEHPYFSHQEGFCQVRADELEDGDFIATPRRLETKSETQQIEINPEKFDFKEKDGRYIVSGKTNSQKFYFPKTVDEDIAELLGLILGDGHINEKKIEFHNNSEKVQERFEELTDRFNLEKRKYNSGSVTQIACRNFSRLLEELLEVPFGEKSSRIQIPEHILKSPDKVLRAFIRSYFAADGYVSDRKREIELSTKSKKMKKQMRMALMRFGITVFTKQKQTKTGEHHRIFIRGKFADKFASKIGIAHPEKQKRLEKMLEKEAINNTNNEVVPEAGPLIKKLRKKLRMNTKQFRESGKDYWAYENEEYGVSRKWFEKISEHFEKRWEELQSLEEQSKLLEKFAEKDYQQIISELDEAREILDISYDTLATDIGFTEAGMRNSIRDQKLNKEVFEEFDEIIDTLDQRTEEFKSVKKETIRDMPEMVDAGIITYKEISNRTEIPVTSVKNYSIGNVTPPEERKEKIEQELTDIKKEVAKNLSRVENTLEKFENISTKTAQVMAALKQFRDKLNIERDEYEEVHNQTVSTVFSGRYQPKLKTLQKLASSTIEIYNEAASKEAESLLDKFKKRANSDIYWDKIETIEFEEPEEETVYDLTVDGKHNFVANGIVAHNSSLLSASMLEIMKNHRIVTVEDTLELPVPQMKNLGYNIERMKSASVITSVESEITADDAIRTSLRLGDSALVIGEVRSDEAQALYEAMRVGAVANFVGGTIHGEDAYSVFDRVVNDLNVPRTSFKATDIIVSVNKIKSPDGMETYRRVTGITEVRKEWTEDPNEEGAFVDLMRYDSNKDELVPTDTLLNGESIIMNRIAENIKEWKNNWQAVWDNVKLRQKMKQTLVDKAEETDSPEILEADFVVKANQRYHILSKRVQEEYGEQDAERVFQRWNEWLERQV